MTTTNLYFNNYAFTSEQRLIEDLIIESIKIYGIEVLYMPRTLINEDELFGEDVLSKFQAAYPIEMYIKSVTGFEGQGEFLSKFNLEVRDEVVFTVSMRRFSEEISTVESTPHNDLRGIGRPSEGDLIYFPLANNIFEVKFVEHEAVFYQMGSLQMYDLRCELFNYSHEKFETGVNAIDDFEKEYSTDVLDNKLLLEDGEELLFEDGSSVLTEDFSLKEVDTASDNEFFKQNSEFINWDESNPWNE